MSQECVPREPGPARGFFLFCSLQSQRLLIAELLKAAAGARSQSPPLGSICQTIINQHSQMLLSCNLLTFPQKALLTENI